MPTLYLCRHAIAEDPHGRMKDADRKLTPEGKRKFRHAAEGFRNLVGKKQIVKILASPLTRARETAEILASALGLPEIELLEPLAPPGNLAAVVREARRAGSIERGILAVGHEPLLGDWLGELCFGKPGHVKFKKGAIAAINLLPSGTKGELLALWDPKTLRHLRD